MSRSDRDPTPRTGPMVSELVLKPVLQCGTTMGAIKARYILGRRFGGAHPPSPNRGRSTRGGGTPQHTQMETDQGRRCNCRSSNPVRVVHSSLPGQARTKGDCEFSDPKEPPTRRKAVQATVREEECPDRFGSGGR